MSSVIPTSLREAVAERAKQRCEYCWMPQFATLHKHEPDHIIPRQHGGETNLENLALACFRCNRYKGPNVGSFDPETGDLVAFYHPRQQTWTQHFVLEDNGYVKSLSGVGRVTVKILRINDDERIQERQRLIMAGHYSIEKT